VKALAVYLVDDTVQEATFKGARISVQLIARDQTDHRGCRAVVRVYNKKGRRIRVWHAANVFSVEVNDS
jgi:hypothetical protein